jgi:phosphoketolase
VAEPREAELDGLLAYWEAANYLTVAQIYLQDNPLLREPLRPEQIKPRLFMSPVSVAGYAQELFGASRRW